MGKDMKIKHSLSSPPRKYGGTFFVKKLCMGNKAFWANVCEDILHGDKWSWSDHVGELMVKRLQRLC